MTRRFEFSTPSFKSELKKIRFWFEEYEQGVNLYIRPSEALHFVGREQLLESSIRKDLMTDAVQTGVSNLFRKNSYEQLRALNIPINLTSYLNYDFSADGSKRIFIYYSATNISNGEKHEGVISKIFNSKTN